MPFSAFPKTFGVTKLKKWYFPHKFNTPKNQAYVGNAPAIDYNMLKALSPQGRQEFKTWHQERRKKQVVSEFQKELVAYRESDVWLLKEGCLIFYVCLKPKQGSILLNT